jgi:hypothetical protein
MATKTKKKKKITSSKKSSPKKKPSSKGKSAKKAAPPKKAATSRKKAAPPKIRTRGKSENVQSLELEPKGLGARSGGQSGDLQGLSDSAGADAESVDELLEEGNAFEAEVVKGVEDAPDADEGEIRTHEVPEDDVREEYLDGDEEGGPSRRGKTRP